MDLFRIRCFSVLFVILGAGTDVSKANVLADFASIQTGHGAGTGSTAPPLGLPQLLPILVRYGFAKYWNVKLPPKNSKPWDYCSATETAKIQKCGIEELYDVIAGGTGRAARARGLSDDFNKALSDACSGYAQFKRCVDEFRVNDCLAVDKAIIDVLYSYLCGEGRKVLETNYTGTCLAALPSSDVLKAVKYEPGCETSWTDVTSTTEMLYTLCHTRKNDKNPKETSGIRQILYTLCDAWYKLEACIFPAYERHCGAPARRFYVGLIDNLKSDLAETFEQVGEELSDLARCNHTATHNISKLAQRQPKHNGLEAYLVKERDRWQKEERASLQKHGPCSPMTTMTRISMCFWQAASEVGGDVVKLSDTMASRQTLIKSLRAFGRCYNDAVEPCPKNAKVTFTELLNISIEMANHASDIAACVDVMSPTNVTEDGCGVTLSDVMNYYIFRGSLIFMASQRACTSNIPFRSFPKTACLRRAFRSLPGGEASSERQENCVLHVLPYLTTFMARADDVISQVTALFRNFFDILCRDDGGH